MMRPLLVALMIAVAPLAAQQPTVPIPPAPPGTSPARGVPSSPPPTAERPKPPADSPRRLMAVQQLALTAYPELRQQGLQIRVDETADAATVTFGFASNDRDSVVEVSRPREAQLVIEATFDAHDAVHTAVLRGTLAHTKERRELKTLKTGIADALDAAGAKFGPANRAGMMRQIGAQALAPVLGNVSATGAAFTQDASDDGVFWQVAATDAGGEHLTLGFEPYAGRLVRITRGGGQ